MENGECLGETSKIILAYKKYLFRVMGNGGCLRHKQKLKFKIILMHKK